MIGALLGLLIVGVVGVVAVIAMIAVASMLFGGMFFLLFKVLPLLLIGWVVVKLVGSGCCGRPRGRISAADQRWLDGE